MITLFERIQYTIRVGPEKQDGTDLTLSESTIFGLEELNKKNQIFLWKGNQKKNLKIAPKDFVGIIQIDDVSFEILPKFYPGEDIKAINRSVILNTLLRMFTYHDLIKSFHSSINSNELTGDDFELLDIFIFLFGKNLLKIIKNKRNLEYIYRFEEIRYIRERIDFKKMWDPTRMHVVPCHFHDLSENNLIFNTLKYCCSLMLKQTKLEKSKRNIRNILSLLENLNYSPVTLNQINHITYNRNNVTFKPFIDFCKFFLSSYSFNLTQSNSNSFSFLFPMDKVFERFFAGVIKEISNNLYQQFSIITQKNIGYLTEFTINNEKKPKFILIPDIVIKNRITDKNVLIIDTKYIYLNHNAQLNDIDRNIIYQISTYGIIQKTPHLMLLFVGNETSENYSGVIKFRENEDVTLTILSINLNRDLLDDVSWMEFRSEIEEIIFKSIHKLII